MKYTPIEGRKLRAFPEDADLPKDSLNERIDEFFIPQAKVRLPEKGKFDEWKTNLVTSLRRQTFQTILHGVGAAEIPEKRLDSSSKAIIDNGILCTIVRYEEFKDADPCRGTLLVAAEKGYQKRLLEGTLTFGMTVRGQSLSEWRRESPPNYVERSHALLGRTVDEGRVKDIIAMVKMLKIKQDPNRQWRIIGRGEAGILAAYAALFEPSIKEVVIIDPPRSHTEGPHFLNVLRVLDIPEALGLLAPTPLTIIGSKDPAFNRTAAIYRLAGAGENLKRK